MKRLLLPLALCWLPAAMAQDENYKAVTITAAEDFVAVRLPLTTTTGKVRVKRRAKDGFGTPIKPSEFHLDESCYLEWQIGYDVPEKKSPSLANGISFERKGKTKYGHELAKILLDAKELGLISTDQLRDVKKFLAENRGATLEDKENISIEPVPESQMKAPLPAGFQKNVQMAPIYTKQSAGNGAIEIHLKHKQFAVGYQAMLYVCLPMDKVLRMDGTARPAGPANAKETVIYHFDRGRMEFLLDIVRAFGLASRQNNEDLTRILEKIITR